MPEQIKRHVAYKVNIKDVLSGTYIKSEGEWDPNFIEINNKQISRVNLMGIVVQNDQGANQSSIILDDGTGRIIIRSFGRENDKIKVEDIVLVIGRPREFGNERYIVPEIIKKIDNKKWVELRKLERSNTVKEESIEIEVGAPEEGFPEEKIIEAIKELDQGEGADIQLINEKINDAEKVIKNLLERGEVFEIKPGRLKVLE
ncbi:MAG: OB-fold nucleic acid binding domain-containing protein [Nanoarchaeota archaeon]